MPAEDVIERLYQADIIKRFQLSERSDFDRLRYIIGVVVSDLESDDLRSLSRKQLEFKIGINLMLLKQAIGQ